MNHLLFSQRMAISRMFEEWRTKSGASGCMENALAWLSTHGAVNRDVLVELINKAKSEPETTVADGRVWQKEAPDTIGCWYMRCNETDFKPSKVEIFIRNNHWMVDDHDGIGECLLGAYHQGLTEIEWCKSTDVIELPIPKTPRRNELKCSCHERDSSQLCESCRSRGYRGHMETR